MKDWERILRGRRFEIVTDHANLTFSSRNSTDVQTRKLRFLSEFDYKLIWKAGEDNVVPDALSRIFGEIASQIEKSEGTHIQIGSDKDRMAEVSAKMAPTESDSAPRWLSKCSRDGAERFIVEKAWLAAIESAHGQGYGDVNASHRGINHTLRLAEQHFKSMGWAVPNDARIPVMEFIRKCITCQKSRAKLDKTTLPRNSLHSDRPFKVIQMDFLEGLGPSNREDVLAKKRKGEYPKPNAILVFVDSFTRYTKLFPVFDKSADTARRCLHKLFCELGIPGVLISDGSNEITT